jgi:hypothetical protein
LKEERKKRKVSDLVIATLITSLFCKAKLYTLQLLK